MVPFQNMFLTIISYARIYSFNNNNNNNNNNMFINNLNSILFI